MVERIKELLQSYNFIDFALLFGSYASKRYTALSDIDIAIYLNRPISLIEQGDIISLLEERLENRVDLIILNGLERESKNGIQYNR